MLVTAKCQLLYQYIYITTEVKLEEHKCVTPLAMTKFQPSQTINRGKKKQGTNIQNYVVFTIEI